MIVYWVAALEIFIYLNAIPLHMVLRFELSETISIQGGFSLFERRFAHVRSLREKQKKILSGRIIAHIGKAPGGARLLFSLIRNIHFDTLTFTGYIATGDAAKTAMIIGGIKGVESMLKPLIPALKTDISPVFNASHGAIELRGMISARSGQIMLAALISAFNYLNGRIAQWINIPSKAS